MNQDENICDLLKAMGESSRFKILKYLTEEPRNVSEIVRALDMQQSLVSHHLRVLRELGLLDATRSGPFVKYSISSPEIIQIFQLAENVANKEKRLKEDSHAQPK